MNGNYDFDDVLKEIGEGNIYRNYLNRIERPLIEWSLKRSWGNQIKAARILGINRNTMRSKIRRLGIDPSVYK